MSTPGAFCPHVFWDAIERYSRAGNELSAETSRTLSRSVILRSARTHSPSLICNQGVRGSNPLRSTKPNPIRRQRPAGWTVLD